MVSIGWVTNNSTCSGANPGHSVWIVTWGCTKLGNTSILAVETTCTPYPSNTAASTITTPR